MAARVSEPAESPVRVAGDPSHPPVEERRPEEELDAENRLVVVRRLQAGAWLVLGGSVLLLLNDLLLHRSELLTLWAPKLVLLAATLATIWALRQPFPLPVLRWIGAGLITTTYFATAIASARLHDVARTPVIAIVIAMTTTYIPFGLGPHVVSLLGAWLAIALNLWLVHSEGGSLAAFGYSGTAFLAATVASIYGAYELQRSLVERRNAARSMLARSEAEREARVASALSQAGHELNASLETAAIADRLTTIVQRLLEADAVLVLLRGAPDEDFAVVATSGGVAGVSRIAPDLLGRWCDGIAAGAVVMPGAEVARTLPELGGCETAWLIALQTGGALGGVVVAGTRGTVDGSEKRLLAHGIAQIASTALANARLLEEVQRASRLKSEFVSTMSHELRTPLNVILGNAEMAADDDVDAVERRRCLEGIERAGRDLLELVEDTLEIGRLDSGRATTTPVEIALPTLWHELRASCAGLAPAAGVRLSWGPEPPAVTVATVVRKVVTITKNLVGNALKFTAHGSVAVGLEPSDGGFVLRVTDTGIGIPPEKHAEVFEMFRQLDGSDSRAYRGTGLGLYIVSRLAAELGGTVALASATGRGSTFTVTLPDPRAAADAARPDASSESVRSRAIA